MLAFAGFVLYPINEAPYTREAVVRGPIGPVGLIGPARPIFLAAVLTGTLSLISIWQWAIEPAYAGYLTAKATSVETFGEATGLWQKALKIKHPWSYDAEVEYLKGATRIAQKTDSGGYPDIRNLLISGAEAAADLTRSYPKNAYYNYLAGRFYSEWGKFEFKYFTPAEEYFNKAIVLSPKRQQLFYGLGRMYLLSGRTEEALQVFRNLVELDKGVDESHWFYGLALQQADKNEEAYEEVKEAIRLGYNAVEPGESAVLAEVATKENDLRALQNIYENAIKIDPKNANWYAKLAALYLEIGLKDQVRRLVLKAVELDPTLKEEATKFLKLLDSRQ
jgi:tetratricopeptide (TPR) repeat protein